jgi:cysteinyl-tRNA synthetase
MDGKIFIYNSLSRKKEEFIPLAAGQVKMYACGPTVYDEPHIGHARSAYIFDVVRRYLVYRGYKVTFVRNITDVDDKIIEKAKEEFKGEDLKAAAEKVARKYLDSYHQAMEPLGIAKPDYEPKATEYIPKMIEFIEELIKNGCAYPAGGDVYFDIRKAKDYGKLSHQSLEKMEVGARVAAGENKKDPLDFALWKAVKEGEPSWDSPWGKGRPGWHIECSAMSLRLLGDEFDIHGGGLDLIFPHHENEIAQSEAAGKKFARYWMHHGLLTINAQKMSKSLGNFVTVTKVSEKYNPDILKLFFLSTHYSSPIDFSWRVMEEKKEALRRIKSFLKNIEKARNDEPRFRIPDTNRILDSDIKTKIDRLRSKFENYMDDDFHTPLAMTSIFEICRICEGIPFYATYKRKHFDILNYAQENIIALGKIFGLSFASDETEEISPTLLAYVNSKIKEREERRRAEDFKKADLIREDLETMGIILEDTKDGKTTWRRKL